MKLVYPEGATPLDPNEAADLLPEHMTFVSQLNEWEQANILRAEDWLSRSRRSSVLSDSFTKELHRRMFDQTWRWAGQYRTTDKNLGVHWPQIPVGVRNTRADALIWIEQAVFSSDEIAVRLHHRMVAVHPFPNGNGRHGRLLADALLMQQGALRFSWGSANLQTTGDARSSYLSALRSADGGDIEPLLRFARS